MDVWDIFLSNLRIPKKGIIIPIMSIESKLKMPSSNDLTSLSDALFSKSQQFVISLFFNHPEKSFYTNDVLRRSNMGRGTVQRELKKLESVGVLTVTNIGNQKHYQANRNCPIYNELRGIVQKTFGITKILQQTLYPIEYKIQQAFIYGSIAKGTDVAESDIDLLVISSKLSYADLMEHLSTAEEKLSRPINPTLYKPHEFAKKLSENNPFLTKVMSQPKLLIIEPKDNNGQVRQSRQNQ